MVLTKADLTANREFNSYAYKIVKDILALNDKALVANLLDLSKKVIVNASDLQMLLKTVLKGRIEIQTDVESKTCDCKYCKVKAHIYENILDITINGKSLQENEPELYEYIVEELNISLTKTYASQMIIVEKNISEEEEEEEEELEETAE